MPLNNFNVPAKAYFIFDLLIQIVTFDFFNPTDYFDFGFSETDPYTDNYDWLGYGSINNVECLGSILVFQFLVISSWIITLLFGKFFRTVRKLKKIKWFKNTFNKTAVW